MPFRSILKISGLFFVFLFAVCACETRVEGTAPDPSYDRMIKAGKESLEKGDGAEANGKFIEAERIRPGDAQAGLGIAISDFLQIVKFADEAIDFAGAFSGGTTGQDQQKFDTNPWWDSEGKGTGDVIDMFVHQIFDGKLEELKTAMDDALSDPGLVFDVGAIPVVFQKQTVLEFRGNWDDSDTLLFDSVARLLEGGVDFLLSVDLNFDFGKAMTLIETNYDSMCTEEMIGGECAMKMIDFLLNEIYDILTDPAYPNFLSNSAEAEWRMPRAGIEFGWMFGDIVAAVDNSYDPRGPLGYVVSIDNDAHDPSERFFYGNLPPVDERFMKKLPFILNICSAAQASLWDGTELDFDPYAGNEFDLSLLNALWADLPVVRWIKLPSKPVDLGAVFLDPDMGQTKEDLIKGVETLIHIVDCFQESDNVCDLLCCLLN